MRALLLALVLALPLAAADGPATAGPGTARMGYVNARVSARQVALNQVVRVDFTTLPRQVEGADIAAAVTRALDTSRLAGHWRPLGAPIIGEHEKTKVVTVSFQVLGRRPGEMPLPRVPLTWLTGEQTADLGLVQVAPQVQIGSELRDLPREVAGVGAWAWGIGFDEVKAQAKPEQIALRDGVAVVRPQPGLELLFRGGALAEAVLTVGGMALPRARDSFLGRWGAPQIETPDAITWILGWTAITATPSADGTGTVLALRREDIQSQLDQRSVEARVFDVLDGAGATPAPTPADQAAQREQDAKREAERVLAK